MTLLRKTSWLRWPPEYYQLEQPFVIGILEGEGIGPDLIRACVEILEIIQNCTPIRFDIQTGGKIGNAAIDECGAPLTPEVINFCTDIFAKKGAIFCGPGGGRFVYDLRKQFNIYCKMVPLKPLPALSNVGPLKLSAVQDVDILVMRENIGGLYQGDYNLHKNEATHSFSYQQQHVDQILKVAIRAAQDRKQKLCILYKPGGIPTISALWQERAEFLSRNKEIRLNFLEVDNAAFQINANAQEFDVIVAPNLFGDVIADGATLLLGSRGLSYSANYGENGLAVYQTGHGAAYDLLGKDIANPLGQIFALAMMLEESFGLETISKQLKTSVEFVLKNGWRTRDIMVPGCQEVSTSKLTNLIAENLRTRLLSKRTALLVIDMQNDFLDRLPEDGIKQDLLEKNKRLVAFCREQQIPVLHIHTNGAHPMPHWEKNNLQFCKPNTQGILAPLELQPLAHEKIIYKRFFNAFSNTDLQKILETEFVDTVILAGLYLHACINTTAIAAYERGFKVWIASDAVGSSEPLHAELSRVWLKERVADFYSIAAITHLVMGKENPKVEIKSVVTHANNAAKIWDDIGFAERLNFLKKWQSEIKKATPQLLKLMISEIHKPYAAAEEELARNSAKLQYIISLGEEALTKKNKQLNFKSLGTCAIITPWNNPVSIPVGKIAPALLFGNSIIWKPSPLTPKIASLILQTIDNINPMSGLVNLVFGEQEIVHQIISAPEVKAVSFTGSIANGRGLSALCHRLEKSFQAELGGNNACIILADADIETIAIELALSAFSFAGQRCTAVRRFIVEQSIVEKFEYFLTKAIQALKIGDPANPETQIGPVINEVYLAKIKNSIAHAVVQGAKILCGGKAPLNKVGSWWEPTLLTNVKEHFAIVKEETFGPVAIIQVAQDIKDAVRLANNVPHGLLASIHTQQQDAINYFKLHIEAGILKFSSKPLAIQPDLPFGGWKASRQGPPEHGIWDQIFYTKPQAIYE